MTKLNVYGLYDGTIETYVNTFQNTHDALIKREAWNIYINSKKAYEQNSLNPSGTLYKYADSFRLIKLADFDDQTGQFTQLEIPVTVVDFADIQQRDLHKDIDIHSDLVSSNN